MRKVLLLVPVTLALVGLSIGQIKYKVPNKTGRGWADGTVGGGYAQPDPNFKPKFTPDGQVVIDGAWRQLTLPGGTGGRNSSLEEIPRGDEALGDLPTGTRVVDPPDGKVPYQPWARTKVKELYAGYIDPLSACAPTGIPRQVSYNNFRIYQTPGKVIFITEAQTNFRDIFLDGRPHPAKNVKFWMGHSVGKWEGNTLVVDIDNLNDKTWMSVRGDIRSDQAHIIEKFWRISEDLIQYEIAIDDPVVFTRSWKMAFPLGLGNRREVMLEQYCAEANHSVEGQLLGGRKLFTGIGVK